MNGRMKNNFVLFHFHWNSLISFVHTYRKCVCTTYVMICACIHIWMHTCIHSNKQYISILPPLYLRFTSYRCHKSRKTMMSTLNCDISSCHTIEIGAWCRSSITTKNGMWHGISKWGIMLYEYIEWMLVELIMKKCDMKWNNSL